jgi:hypothetical protein
MHFLLLCEQYVLRSNNVPVLIMYLLCYTSTHDVGPCMLRAAPAADSNGDEQAQRQQQQQPAAAATAATDSAAIAG